MRRILIATSNAGKLRDFAGAASAHEIEIAFGAELLLDPYLWSKMV